MEEITNSEDVIDSRNVISRIEELREDRDILDNSELFELDALITLDKTGRNFFSDNWEYGVGLVRDSYFETYAKELAEDIGAIDPNIYWPGNHIDWESAAEELQMSYTSIEFDEVEFWARWLVEIMRH